MVPFRRSHLAFSNIVALIALMLALGGVSYATVNTLTAGSVGRKQIKRHAVTAPKLATGSVHRRALSRKLRRRLAASASGPAASRAAGIHFFTHAMGGSPSPQTILDSSGLRLTAVCQLTGSTTALNLSARSREDGAIQDNFNVDGGTDPHNPGSTNAGNIEIDLPAGAEISLAGPNADPPNFFRVIATAIYSSQGRVMSFNISELVDGSAGTCAVDGVAVPTS